MRKSIDLDLSSNPDDSTVLSSSLGEFLDELHIPESAKYDILICCDEVFSNIYMHAYDSRRDGRIKVSARADRGSVTIVFTDYGSKVFPSGQPVSLPSDSRNRGGYGLFIIHKLMDEVRTSRTKAGNQFLMRKICSKMN